MHAVPAQHVRLLTLNLLPQASHACMRSENRPTVPISCPSDDVLQPEIDTHLQLQMDVDGTVEAARPARPHAVLAHRRRALLLQHTRTVEHRTVLINPAPQRASSADVRWLERSQPPQAVRAMPYQQGTGAGRAHVHDGVAGHAQEVERHHVQHAAPVGHHPCARRTARPPNPGVFAVQCACMHVLCAARRADEAQTPKRAHLEVPAAVHATDYRHATVLPSYQQAASDKEQQGTLPKLLSGCFSLRSACANHRDALALWLASCRRLPHLYLKSSLASQYIRLTVPVAPAALHGYAGPQAPPGGGAPGDDRGLGRRFPVEQGRVQRLGLPLLAQVVDLLSCSFAPIWLLHADTRHTCGMLLSAAVHARMR